MAPNPPFKLAIPTFADKETGEAPPIAGDIAQWNILATAVESPAIDPVALARELDKLFPTKHPEVENSGDFLWQFWKTFTQAASQIPALEDPGQDRLVAIIRALRDLPDPIPVPMLDASWGVLKLWSDLPWMESAFREAHREVVDADQGINLEAFFIRLTVADLLGFEYLGLYALVGALEFRPEPRSTAYDKRTELLDSAAPCAALWIQLAGARLYECCLAEKYRDNYGSWRGPWKGPAGFSKQRWNSWKLRFLEICGDDWPTRRTKDLAWDAMNYMNYIDGSMLE